jgi:DNA-binding MarR family transcriptional regulator
MDTTLLDSLIVDLHIAYKSVVSEADEFLSLHGLARSHHKVLFFVARHAMCKSTDVQSFVGVTRQAMQRPLTDLHKMLLIESVVAPHNRRTHLLRITPLGTEIEAHASKLIQEHFVRAFSELKPSEIDVWKNVMSNLASPLKH